MGLVIAPTMALPMGLAMMGLAMMGSAMVGWSGVAWAQGAGAAQAQGTTQASATQGPAAEGGAVEGFPTLTRAIELARQRSPAVVASRAQVEVARAGGVGARLTPVGNPYVEITGDRATNAGPDRGLGVNANLWLPLEVWGQRGRRVAEVDAQVAWSSASFDAQRALAMGEAVRAFGTAMVEAQRVQLLESILTVARAEAALYAARVEAGDATAQDVAMARVEVARNSVALAESRADLTRALTDLARVTGVDAYGAPVGDEAPPVPEAGVAGGGSDALAARSPHVTVLEVEARFRERARERLQAEARTPLSLMVLSGRGDTGDLRLGLGAAITFPVLRFNQGEQAIAEAERGRALAEAGAQRASVRAGLVGLQTERRQVRAALVEIATQVEPAGQAAVDAAVAMQKAGKGELLRVLTARRDLANLKTRRLELLRREWSLVAQIASLTGELR